MRTIRLYDGSLVIILVLSLLMWWTAETNQKKWTEDMNKAMSSWVGSSQSQLFVQWGTPTETYSDNNGGSIVVYREGRERQTGGYTSAQVNPFTGNATITSVPPRVQEWKVWRAFWIDRSGRIYHWAWQGF